MTTTLWSGHRGAYTALTRKHHLPRCTRRPRAGSVPRQLVPSRSARSAPRALASAAALSPGTARAARRPAAGAHPAHGISTAAAAAAARGRGRRPRAHHVHVARGLRVRAAAARARVRPPRGAVGRQPLAAGEAGALHPRPAVPARRKLRVPSPPPPPTTPPPPCGGNPAAPLPPCRRSKCAWCSGAAAASCALRHSTQARARTWRQPWRARRTRRPCEARAAPPPATPHRHPAPPPAHTRAAQANCLPSAPCRTTARR